MLLTSVLLLPLAAVGLAQVAPPEGYRKVYITSNVNTKFVIVPEARTAGSTTTVKTLYNKPEQQWYIKNGTTNIQLVDSTLCMDGGAKKRFGRFADDACQNLQLGYGVDRSLEEARVGWLSLGSLLSGDRTTCVGYSAGQTV
ncbi:hypothetical protein VTI74DRAFT_1090 [Chaetomium olivicolor]